MKSVSRKTTLQKSNTPKVRRLGAVGIRRLRPGFNAAINEATERVCKQREAEALAVSVQCPPTPADSFIAKHRDVANAVLRTLGLPLRVSIIDSSACDSETERSTCGGSGQRPRYALVPLCPRCGHGRPEILRVVDTCGEGGAAPGCGAFEARFRCPHCGQCWSFDLGFDACDALSFAGVIPTPDRRRAWDALSAPVATRAAATSFSPLPGPRSQAAEALPPVGNANGSGAVLKPWML